MQKENITYFKNQEFKLNHSEVRAHIYAFSVQQKTMYVKK